MVGRQAGPTCITGHQRLPTGLRYHLNERVCCSIVVASQRNDCVLHLLSCPSTDCKGLYAPIAIVQMLRTHCRFLSCCRSDLEEKYVTMLVTSLSVVIHRHYGTYTRGAKLQLLNLTNSMIDDQTSKRMTRVGFEPYSVVRRHR